MNSVTEPVVKEPRRSGTTRTARDWLDALTTDACDQEGFFNGVRDLLQRAPDSGWELLGLVDQYYRRGKITAQAFGVLKTHLQSLLRVQAHSDEVQSPAPRMLDEPPESPSHAATVAVTQHRDAYAAPLSMPSPPPSPSPRSLAAGDVLRGRYLVQGLLGQGGMGTVYAAIDQFRLDQSNLDQKLALKVLHTEVIQRPSLFAELRREFQHLQSLSHPNIVRVHEFDRDGDLAFFTMEYLQGSLLSRVLAARGSLPLHRPDALAIVRDVGGAVAHAHARGVVHGDLNPGNVFITDAGEVRVLDFGAAHKLRRGPWISEFDGQEQIAVATPAYASCQTLEGEVADARDDVYALACIAYMLLTGEHPFKDNTALKARTLGVRPRRPRGLNRRQWNALRAGLYFDRDRRPPDMQAWLQRLDLRAAAPVLPDLQSLWNVRRPPRGGSNWAVAAVLAVLSAAVLYLAAVNADSIARASAAAGARVKSMVARAIASHFWDKSFAMGRPEPVIVAPADATLPAHAGPIAGSTLPADAGSVARGTLPAGEGHPARATLPVGDGPPARATLPADAELAASATQSTDARPPARATLPADVEPPAPATLPAHPAPSGGPLTGQLAPSTAAAGLAEPARYADATAAPARPAADRTGTATAAPRVAAATESLETPAPRTGGSSHIELAADTIDVDPADPMAHVVVRRKGSSRSDVSFKWWTESGTAKPGRDFVPVKSQVEHIESGQTAVSLIIPVVRDSARRQSRSFYVVIDEPSDGATLGSRTLTMVTLPGSDPDPEPAPAAD